MKTEELYTILRKGILAPSADNLQPWKFKLFNNQVDLFLDPERVKNFCDEGLLVPYLSTGAVIENIRVATTQTGYELSTSYLPIKTNPLWVASLRFSEVKKENHPHFENLSKRVTNRKFYKVSQKIDLFIYSKLSNIVESKEGFKLLWLKKDQPAYSKLSRLLGKADQLRFENERLHKELIETLRFNRQAAEKTKDGLDLRTFEAGPGGNLLFKLAQSWQRLKFLNAFGMSRLFNFYTWLQMYTSQAAGLIVAKSHEPVNYIVGGEVMEKTWHELTGFGLSIQPMEALPIFIINSNLTGDHNFDPKQRKKIEELKQKFLPLFGITNQSGLIFLFRIGYAEPATTHSLRRPLEDFLL